MGVEAVAPEIQHYLRTLAVADQPSLSSQDPVTARASAAAEFARQWGTRAPDLHVENLLFAASHGHVRVRRYDPGVVAPSPAVVFAHGGGWVLGDLETHDGLCRSLADDAGAVVLAVDYRRAPEQPFPAAVEDVSAAVVWAFEQAQVLGVDASSISVAGDSAGGNLTAVAVAEAVARGLPVASQVLIYPVTDTRTDTDSYLANGQGLLLSREDMVWFFGHYLQSAAHRDDPRAAPLRGSLPTGVPTYVTTCAHDPLRDEGVAYVAALRAAGGHVVHDDWPGMIHGFVTMRTITPAADALRRRVVTFLLRSWGRAAEPAP
ncbi:MAG: alpha/beta hydrolase [Actinomycetota bacterium]|nr:alpha/beta hydrolase [Actinomycetota bacterium]